MADETPTIILIGGPNGAGKSTVAPRLIEHAFGSIEFVNADVIAAGLSGLHPDRQAFVASGGAEEDTIVHAPELWNQLKRMHHDA